MWTIEKDFQIQNIQQIEYVIFIQHSWIGELNISLYKIMGCYQNSIHHNSLWPFFSSAKHNIKNQ